MDKVEESRKNAGTVKVVFVSLLLDLLGFTMILPLFPALLDYYEQKEDSGLYHGILGEIRKLSVWIGAPDKIGTVLFGGKSGL